MTAYLLTRSRDRASNRVAAGPPSLSSRLRDATRKAHIRAETAFTLDARLASREAYIGTLADLRGFYAPVEAAVAALPGWSGLTPAIDIQARRRRALLDDDLRRLDFAGPPGGAEAAPPAMPKLAHGLGCLYVLEGSALGGRIVARQARAALGHDLPVAFFSSAGRDDLGADWRALQAALDAFGFDHGAAERRAVVIAANATFTALVDWLEEGRLRP